VYTWLANLDRGFFNGSQGWYRRGMARDADRFDLGRSPPTSSHIRSCPDPSELAKRLVSGRRRLLAGFEGQGAGWPENPGYEVSNKIGAAADPKEIAVAVGEHWGSEGGRWLCGGSVLKRRTASPSSLRESASAGNVVRRAAPGCERAAALAFTGVTIVLRARELPAPERRWRRWVRVGALVPLVASGEKQVGLLPWLPRKRGFSRVSVRAHLTRWQPGGSRAREPAAGRGSPAGRGSEESASGWPARSTIPLAQGFTSIVMHGGDAAP